MPRQQRVTKYLANDGPFVGHRTIHRAGSDIGLSGSFARQSVMLEQLSELIRGCFERAAEAKAQADATIDPALKADFLGAERRWLALARSYGFTESLGDFTEANSERRRRFEQRLRTNMKSAPASSLSESAEQILWSIVENSDDAIITKNLDGII
jgi:hypothetical protein